MEIPILNIYYLLAYAWNKLDESDIQSVQQIDNRNIINLFARVLASTTSSLLRKGLDRGYNEERQISGIVKGKINLTNTFIKGLLPLAKVECTYDELSHNVIHNRILKSTINSLLLSDELEKGIQEQLKLSFLRLPPDINLLKIRKEHFRDLRFSRNNFYYDFLMKICEIIYDNYLVDESSGKSVFRDFTRDPKQMANLFESFVTNFYIKHKAEHGYKVSPQRQVKWFGANINGESNYLLPNMYPDIVFESDDRNIVFDAKYYKNALKEHYNNKKISSNNLYQMFAYMRNLAKEDDAFDGCDGILLYPVVNDSFDGASWTLHGHTLHAKMINLNQDWKTVHHDLIEIFNQL